MRCLRRFCLRPKKRSVERLQEDSTKFLDCDEIPEQVERTSIEDEQENVAGPIAHEVLGNLTAAFTSSVGPRGKARETR